MKKKNSALLSAILWYVVAGLQIDLLCSDFYHASDSKGWMILRILGIVIILIAATVNLVQYIRHKDSEEE